jgi:hypothetical protein
MAERGQPPAPWERQGAGGDRYRQTVVLTHLGDAFHAAGDLRAACDTWRSALVILEDLDHPDADDLRARLAGPGGGGNPVRRQR